MYQGPITLSGLNLDIADAAAKAGFNHWNHKALYDLIWAVKRVAIHQKPGGRPAAKRRDVYPDRYRPSGHGDNTGKKRSTPMTDLATNSGNNADIEHDRGNKRQKVTANQSVLRATAPAYRPQGVRDTTSAFARQESFVPLNSRAANQSNHQNSRRRYDLTPIELKMVGSKLDRVAKEIAHCRDIMRSAYDRHPERLNRDETIKDLRDLAKYLELAEENSKEGVATVDHIRGLLEHL